MPSQNMTQTSSSTVGQDKPNQLKKKDGVASLPSKKKNHRVSTQEGVKDLTTPPQEESIFGLEFEERIVPYEDILCDEVLFPNSRKVLKEVDDLAVSIYVNGLDNPMMIWRREMDDGNGGVVERDLLIAGFRRYYAIELLLSIDKFSRREMKERYNIDFTDDPKRDLEERFGFKWTEDPAQRFRHVKIRSFRGSLLDARKVHFRENAKRVNLTPVEWGDYLLQMKKENKDLQHKDLAEIVGYSPPWVSEKIRFAEMASEELKKLVCEGEAAKEKFKRKEIGKLPETISYSNALLLTKKHSKKQQDEIVKEFRGKGSVKSEDFVKKHSNKPKQRKYSEVLGRLHDMHSTEPVLKEDARMRFDQELEDLCEGDHRDMAEWANNLSDMQKKFKDLRNTIRDLEAQAFLDGQMTALYWSAMTSTPNDPRAPFWIDIESISEKEAYMCDEAIDAGEETFVEKVKLFWEMAEKASQK